MRNVFFIAAAAALFFSVTASAQDAAAPKKMTKAQLIASAISAAPKSVGRKAAVVTFDDAGKMTTLREGTNGFTCIPDDPTTPGPDPVCADRNALEWATALMAHKDPPAGKVGFMYMLKGGTDASNTDPYAAKPGPDGAWLKTGPHVMIVGAATMTEGYPRSAKPDTSQPYVMWPGTPYEHLMIPVK